VKCLICKRRKTREAFCVECYQNIGAAMAGFAWAIALDRYDKRVYTWPMLTINRLPLVYEHQAYVLAGKIARKVIT
jgi:hypothetical protein